MASQLLQKVVSLRQIFAVRPFALVEIGHGVQPQPVHAHIEPEIERLADRLVNLRVVEVQVGLMRIKAMPVVGLGHRIPGPVGRLEILEDDAGFLVFVRRVAPDIEVARRGCRASRAGRAETRDAGRKCG